MGCGFMVLDVRYPLFSVVVYVQGNLYGRLHFYDCYDLLENLFPVQRRFGFMLHLFRCFLWKQPQIEK